MWKNWPSGVPLFCKCILLLSANISVFIYFHLESIETEAAWAEYKFQLISGGTLFIVEANYTPFSLRAGLNVQNLLVSVMYREQRYKSVISGLTPHAVNPLFMHCRNICGVAAVSWPWIHQSYTDIGISSTWVYSDGFISGNRWFKRSRAATWKSQLLAGAIERNRRMRLNMPGVKVLLKRRHWGWTPRGHLVEGGRQSISQLCTAKWSQRVPVTEEKPECPKYSVRVEKMNSLSQRAGLPHLAWHANRRTWIL